LKRKYKIRYNHQSVQSVAGKLSCMTGLDCAVFYVPPPTPTQYMSHGRRFLQVKRPNQQHQSTKGSYKGEQKQHKQHNTHRNTKQYTIKR